MSVKALFLALLAAGGVYLAGVKPAHAGPPPGPALSAEDATRVARMQDKRNEMVRPDVMRQDEADLRRRAEMMQDRGMGDPARRNSRMTPEERRDLRRQINEVGQDLYKR